MIHIFKKKQSSWRQQHEDFVAAIRYAKMAGKIEKEGGNLAYLPPPPPSKNDDYIQCPHCLRRFNQVAGSRHIPKCKETVNKPKPPPHLRGGQQQQQQQPQMNGGRGRGIGGPGRRF